MAINPLIVTLILSSTILLALAPHIYWFIGYGVVASLIGASLAFGSISVLVSARRLYFMAHVVPHMAIFAAPIAIIVTRHLQVNEWLLSAIIVMILLWASGYAISRGLSSDIIASLSVSFTASATIIALYYAQRIVGAGRISSIILGDPLLTSISEGLIALVVGSMILLASLMVVREMFYISVDREGAIVDGLRVVYYDYTLYTLIGVTVAIMLKIVGFLVSSILILVPGAVSLLLSRSSYEALMASIGVSLIASALGLYAGILLDIPPSGALGLILVAIYALVWVARSA
ncbi:MAG: metal ABC transporter permease [Acidilobaceae archaeon]